MIYNDEQTALELWDTVDEDSSIFIPIMIGSPYEKNSIFMETLVTKKEERSWVRVFLDKEEALAYKQQKNKKGMSIATTTVLHFVTFLKKHCNYEDVDKKVECVLSTIDIDGKFHNIDLVWNNYERDS